MKSVMDLNRLVATTLALSALLVASATRPVYSQPAADAPLSAPLDPEDPRAKLDPDLANLPAVPQPSVRRQASLSPMYSANEVGLDLKTGRLAVKSFRSPGKAGAIALVPGRAGTAAQPDTEPRSSRVVIGSDDRIKITNTASYPWSAQCKLYITFPDGARFVGSGTLIGHKYVLTAGHCVYSRSNGGWARSISAYPGLNGSYAPFGSAYATYLRSYTGWTYYGSADHDFGLITLNRSVGYSTGWLGYGYWSSLTGVTANLSGYPADRDGGVCQYYGYGPVKSTTSYRLFYDIDTAGGQSGSGVYRIINGSRYVMGAHAYGAYSGNSATRLDYYKYNSLVSWINSGY